MLIRMSCKYTPEPYHSRGFDIELSPEDIGLSSPATQEEFSIALKEMTFQAAKAVHVFLMKEGKEDKDTVISILKVYKP